MKKKILYVGYWILQCTWGIIMTLIGAVAALILLMTGHKPQTMGPNVYFKVGSHWGGINLGPFFFCCEDADDQVLYHEAGHGLQNLVWGPLFPFVIGLPSLVRSWLRQRPTRLKKSLFNLFFLIASILITTLLACITGPLLHWHWITIGIELLRAYFAVLSIWLTTCEIPKYNQGYVEYDEIWFEGQATYLGTKVYEKKED